MKRLLLLTANKPTFRVPELNTLGEMFKIPDLIKLSLPDDRATVTINCSDSELSSVLSRSIAIHQAFTCYAQGTTHEDLLKDLKKSELFKNRYYHKPEIKFAFKVVAVNKKLADDKKRQIEIYKNCFDQHPEVTGAIDLKNPDCRLFFIEEYSDDYLREDKKLIQVYLGSLVGEAQRKLKTDFDIKKRSHVGNTSMEPEVSFYQANMAKVVPNSIVYDPFCGSGSNLISAAHFGAYVIGSDLDYNIIYSRGKSSKVGQGMRSSQINLKSQLTEYGLQNKFLNIFRSDFSTQVWRRKENQLDAIVCDPPYGVREVCKKVGKKTEKQSWTEKVATYPDWVDKKDTHNFIDIRVHFPQKVEYCMEQLFKDLVKFAALTLKIGGRLTFWLPVSMAEYQEHKISHPDMKFIASCIEKFHSRTGRQLWVFEKRRPFSNSETFFESQFYKENSFRDLHLNSQS